MNLTQGQTFALLMIMSAGCVGARLGDETLGSELRSCRTVHRDIAALLEERGLVKIRESYVWLTEQGERVARIAAQ